MRATDDLQRWVMRISEPSRSKRRLERFTTAVKNAQQRMPTLPFDAAHRALWMLLSSGW
jgi:hypothetical protein